MRFKYWLNISKKKIINSINYIKLIWFTILILILKIECTSQNNFRRHFIIAYDISTPFIRSEKNCPAYKESLIKLFSNKNVNNYHDAYDQNLKAEVDNGVEFFNPEKDNISFYHFNIAGSEFVRLRWAASYYKDYELIDEFNNTFIKDKGYDWATFKKTRNYDLNNYFNDVFSIKPSPHNFSGGVSMSNFIYPLILDKIDSEKFAEEYILIILSDFLTGSMLGNTKDLDRVKDIFLVPYNIALSTNSPVNIIKNKIDYLASKYFKIEFFQYSFIPVNSKSSLGVISYKIKPKAGVYNPENVSLSIDGNLSLIQGGYESNEFTTSKTKIKFTHNKNLISTELRKTIFLSSKDTNKILFDDIIASKDHSDKWYSKYTTDKDLMRFNDENQTYYIPNLTISIDSTIKKRNFENLKFRYEFKTKYIVANAQPLNFIFSTERELPIENIDYSTQATIIIMYYLLPILAFLLLVIFLAYYGKPRKLSFQVEGYLDSFEKIDYKTDGKLLTPYKAWNYKEQNGVDHLLVNGNIEHKSDTFPFNWNSPVYLKLTVEKIPSGFEVFLKQDINDLKEFSTETPTAISKDKNNKLSFVVGIRQTDISKIITDPELVKFSVETVVKDSRIFIKSELREIVAYKFHLGADLRDVWVGFDPGTSGSCIAVGSSTDNITLGEDRAKNKIIPSVLVFEKAEKFQQNGAEIPEKLYKHGTAAHILFKNKRQYKGFQSIKKLLGFKDLKEITFDNNNTLALKGKDLAGLLVKGLFNDINTYFNRPDFNADDYKRDGKFNPLRAVVAIPNNFTTSKIQDMVDCIANLNQFKEIRYVYEAEAVLFYYLSNYSQFSEGEASSDSETILVFDMGGATINATVVTANKTLINGRPKYDIDFLGKIGYGIGGDTIDYCISKFILSFVNDYPELSAIDIYENKEALSSMALSIKKTIIENSLATMNT